jgi:anti-anti-sigma regulatory factor
MIRISEIGEGSKQDLLVEGRLSGNWVDVLEVCWLEAQTLGNGEPIRLDLSGVTYIDEKGRQLLARMVRDGAELRAAGVMTGMVIEEITARETSTETKPETRVQKQAGIEAEVREKAMTKHEKKRAEISRS